ncbi:MAG TPA: PIN domain-containing protein [Polyangiaceae bacterium]|jgi:hypothetical protein
MKLVDTSVWIECFRARSPLDLEKLVALDEVVTCLPVVQEVLHGFRDEAAYRRARMSMLSLPMVGSPLDETLFLEAVDLYRSARRAGLTVRSSVDCLIAACAIRHDLEVLHADRDFSTLARVSRLREASVPR